MGFYRKLPVVIEARQYSDVNAGIQITHWANQFGVFMAHTLSGLVIPTLEGKMLASPGDYIIKGVNGEFYPCKPDIFEKTYEEVLEP